MLSLYTVYTFETSNQKHMTYSQLTIHQKINCKSNSIFFYRRMTLAKIVTRDPDCFTPNKLYIK